jgi:putative lipoic acid-binding regulatory protein
MSNKDKNNLKKTEEKQLKETQEESLLKFPCSMPIKVIGKSTDEFEITILQIFHTHFPKLKENCLEIKKSSKNTYLALTVTIEAESKKQLDNLYQDLTSCPLVLWAL